jgi:1-deoxy-D-xylulose-5-phosphate synthase
VWSLLRQAGGLSGYPSREESGHDVIENSHASSALSCADGMAKALALSGRRDRRLVAIVGDGALTGGMCWEALNNISGAPDRPVVIVLNDNGRSYAPTIGGAAHHLATLRTARPGPAGRTCSRTWGWPISVRSTGTTSASWNVLCGARAPCDARSSCTA